MPLANPYDEIYGRSMNREVEWLDVCAREMKVPALMKCCSAVLPGIATVCEIGCGCGSVLLELKERGIGTAYFGVEMNAVAAEKARERMGGRVQVEIADAGKGGFFPGRSFDLIVASHILEHLSNPRGALANLQERCKYLYAEVPLGGLPMTRLKAALKSLAAGTRRRDSVVGHVQFFTARTFRALVESAGFETIASLRYYPMNSRVLRAKRQSPEGSHPGCDLALHVCRLIVTPWLTTRLDVAHFGLLARPGGERRPG